MSTTIAITGATGFVGSHLIEQAVAQGFHVKALTRRPQPSITGVEWIEGSLDTPDKLLQLTNNSNAVIHVAGVINARTDAEFEHGNVTGTAAIMAAAHSNSVKRFIHISSLAAREPSLSAYGRSKAKSEALLTASSCDWTIVRPPAIYGPRDKETFELFKMAKRGVVLLPPAGSLSVIHALDLADLLIALAAPATESQRILEPDDGKENGWEHRLFARAIGQAIGRNVCPVSLPAPLIRLGASLDTGLSRMTGRLPKLSHDRASYFCHPDWVASEEKRPDKAVWQPQISTKKGLADTASWYRNAGWL